jgi:hypothetical protein
MKRMRPLLCLALGLLVAPVGAPLADPPLGGYDDRRGGYGNHAQERRQPDDRQRADRYGNSAERRPLGTLHDDFDRRNDDRGNRWERSRDNDRYDRYDRRDRYDHDAARAAESVRRDERGRVLSSRPDDRGYRVRVLTPDGYVRERYVDPRDDRDDGRRYRDRD